jgi:AcrR family transcriptional regulator
MSTGNHRAQHSIVERITDGVFFSIPSTLPRGRHELARAQVLAVQRERLMIAMTELMAERGYEGIGIRDIAARAGVSSAAFYECFADKRTCVFAAYDRFIGVLLERLARAAAQRTTWDAWVLGMIHAYLDTLQQDLVVGRAFQVEMDAVGKEARERRRIALQGLADLIQAERERLWSADRDPLPQTAYIGVVYAVRQIACDALDRDPHPDLHALAPELSSWVGETLRGTAAAQQSDAVTSRGIAR